MDRFALTRKRQAEAAIIDVQQDFIATYHAVADLRHLARSHAGVVDGQTIVALEYLLQSKAFEKARQAAFLFREAASVLTDMAAMPGGNGLSSKALAALIGLLSKLHGSAHRGVAEALGALPVGIAGPRPTCVKASLAPKRSWAQLLAADRLRPCGSPRYIGRSLVSPIADGNRLLVVKLAKQTDTHAGLANEIRWMETLQEPSYRVNCRFHIPRPLRIGNQPLFRINRLPLAPPAALDRHPDRLAIAFVAHRDYFVYANHPNVNGDMASEILGRNAFLMGWLAAKGVIHDAPIPLFHNRTQRLRREDQGRYQWYRAGRLDQWLDSCAFPNLGMSGLRDFEHLVPLSGSGHALYRHIGSHFLGLLLLAGSHFRCRDKSRFGLDANGRPIDARHLFDQGLLKTMVSTIFENYHRGFTGGSTCAELPFNLGHLVDRMIEEMGVDRYMTELLRRTDQQALTERQFLAFLKGRGYKDEQLIGLKRGEKDMLIVSGPHLGDFNRQICLPEMIEAVAAMSAVCVAGHFTKNAMKSVSTPT
jgi:hypothetical protein